MDDFTTPCPHSSAATVPKNIGYFSRSYPGELKYSDISTLVCLPVRAYLAFDSGYPAPTYTVPALAFFDGRGYYAYLIKSIDNGDLQ